MRALPVRRLASTVLSAAVIAAITGPVAVAVDAARGHGEAPASQAALPGAAKLLAQVRALDHAGALPKPVVQLLDRSLTKGRLSAAEAERLGDAAKQAVVRAMAQGTPGGAQAPGEPTAAAAPAQAATPSAAANPATPAAPSAPAAVPSGSESQSAASPAAPLNPAPQGMARSVPVARDLVGDVLAAVDALVNAAVSDVDQVVATGNALVDKLLSALGIGVPTPTPTPTTLPSVPALPSTPAPAAG
ncbi:MULTISPECIES: hypothetical protein [unclassified Streptomyces]|uniref:hypothetical protein n=1 Tax=unclassified Streptomyces TaxID=2593676 RepID=UPI00332C43ED